MNNNHYFYGLAFIAIFFLFLACKKEINKPDNQELEEAYTYTIEALPENDNRSIGVYRGFIRRANGFGRVKVQLFNGNDVARIIVEFNYQIDTLLPVYPLEPEEFYLQTHFSGKHFFAWLSIEKLLHIPQLSLSPLENGAPTYEDPQFLGELKKERSHEKVHVLMGSYSSSTNHTDIPDGTLDGILIEGVENPINSNYKYQFNGIMVPSDAPFGYSMGGSFDHLQLTIKENIRTGFSFSGALSDRQITGTWANSKTNTSGEWQATMVEPL